MPRPSAVARSTPKRRKSRAQLPQTQYLATDLEVVSRRSLNAYRMAIGKRSVNRDAATERGRVILLGIGGRWREGDTVDQAINRDVMNTVRFVRGLPTEARAEWDRASTKTVDIGLQAGMEPNPLEFRLTPKTLQAIDEIGARLQVTVYAAPQSQPDPT